MKPFFSVIVPVYNVSEYLEECFKSVINQSFKDFEIILVDDGSTDNSSVMCDNYAARDERVKVVHKENGGLSSARNAGLAKTEGKYVLFLDSDDYWNDSDMLQLLYDKITQSGADIMMFGCTDFNMLTNESVVSRTGYDLTLLEEGDYKKSLHYLLSTKMIPGGSTIFAMSRDIIVSTGFTFKEGIQNEDYDYVLTMFLNSKSISAVNNPFYMYRKGRSDSITGTRSIKMIYGMDYTLNKWLPIADKIENETIKKDVLNYLAFIYSTSFVILGRLPKEQVNEASKIIKTHKSVIKYGYWKKTKVIRFADSVLGDRLFSKLSVIYYKYTHIGV